VYSSCCGHAILRSASTSQPDTGIRFLAGLAQDVQHFAQHVLDVAHDGHIHLHALGNGRRVHVDVDDLLRLRQEVRRHTDHAVVKTRTDGNQHITVLHRHIGFVGTVHAQHAEELRIGTRIGTQAHQGVGTRQAQRLHQLGDFGCGIALHGTATDIDVGTLGFQQKVDGLLDLSRMAAGGRHIGTDVHVFRVVEFGTLLGDILGNIHHHGAGTAALGNVKGFLDGGCQVVDVLDQEVVLHARAGDAHHVHFLEGIQTDGRGGHLAGNHHHRNGVHIGRGNAGHGIGGTGPEVTSATPTLSLERE
jgi:hypothetical protein